MRQGTDQTGEAAIRAATEFIVDSLRAKNERVDDKARMRIERDVAGTFAWLVSSYEAESNPNLVSLVRKVIAGALETRVHTERLVEGTREP